MAVHPAQSPLPSSAVFVSMPFICLVQNLMVFFSLLPSALTTHSTRPLPAPAPSVCLLDLSLSFTETLFSPPYTEAACGSFVSSLGWAGGVLPFWDCFQIAAEGSKSIIVPSLTCRRPSVLQHPEYHQSRTSALSNCEDLGDFFCLWWVSSYILRHINHLAYNDIKTFFSNVCLWKVSSFFRVADRIFKRRILLSALFCTIVYTVHIVVLYHTVSGTETAPFLENHNIIGNCLVEDQKAFSNSLPTPAS